MLLGLHNPRRRRLGDLLVLHDPMPGPLTALAVVIRAGSRFDGAHPGIAHVAEHMLFQGTRRADQATLNHRAAMLGGDLDAETGHDDLTLSIEVFNDDVEPALALLSEICFESTIAADRFAKERRVVIDEIRGRLDDPAHAAYEATWSRFFDPSLGHPVCGTIASLRRMSAQAVRHFVRRHVVPSNMVLAATGGVSAAVLGRAIRRTWPCTARAWRARARPPRIQRVGTLRLRRHDTSQSHVVRIAAAPHAGLHHLALVLALETVGADPDARLYQELRERLGLGYDVSAEVEVGSGWAVSLVSASAGRDDHARLRRAVAQTLVGAAGALTEEEVARARRKLQHRYARLRDARMDRAITHAARAAAERPPVATTARLLERVRLADVQAAWLTHLRSPSLTCVLTA